MSDAYLKNEQAATAGTLGGDTLADGVLILLTLTVVQRLVGFVRAVLFCRWLDVDQLGQWDMAWGFLLLAAPLAIFALPGAFGRYLEHYRQRGQLKTFLRRTAILCAGLAVLAAGAICLTEGWFSELIFGTPDRQHLVALLAVSLVAVISFNFITELLTALRQARVVSILQLVNSLSFAALGIGLLVGFQDTAASVVLAYGGACLLSSLAALGWLRKTWDVLPEPAEPLTHHALWSKLVPFAAWIWLGNMLSNLYDMVNRYMLVHCGPADPNAALALVGEYHSSRVVPVLLISIATMLGGFLTPHLSCDWEAGRRDRVAARLNLFLKLLSFSLTTAAAAAVLAAPLLFRIALRGKFAAGEAILPWTLIYCTWFALAMVAQNYLWCAEKARLGSLALVAGLTANVGLNLLLLPPFGLRGVVLATCAANALTLVLVCGFTRMIGFRIHRSTAIALALPVVICLGPWAASAILLAVALDALLSTRWLTAAEKTSLAETWARYQRLLGERRKRGQAPFAGTARPTFGRCPMLSKNGACPLFPRRRLMLPEDRGPLRVIFVITSMPVGGMEILLAELVRGLDRSRFAPEICCLKTRGPLGDRLAGEVPIAAGFLSWKYDATVLWRVVRHIRARRADAVITVGTGGDKMFWGRLAAWLAGTPVICSALHSTGVPDRVEPANRLLAPITDAFIAVAQAHGRYLAEHEGCPATKVRVIPNGIDTAQFHPRWPNEAIRAELRLPDGVPLVAVVAALRPEKNHELFLRAAQLIREQVPEARFLVIGDGPERERLETLSRTLSLDQAVQFLGNRHDVPEVLSLVDVFVLTSHMEASPVSILEAMASEKPVVATCVGSIPETILEGETGFLVPPGDAAQIAARVIELFRDPDRAQAMGRAGRERVLAHWTSHRMVVGYEELIAEIYRSKCVSAIPRPADGHFSIQKV